MSRHLRKYLPMIQYKNKASNNDDAQCCIVKCGQQVNKPVLTENNKLDNKMEINNIKHFLFHQTFSTSCWGHSTYVPTVMLGPFQLYSTAMLGPFHLCSNCDVRAIPFIFNCDVGAIPFIFQVQCWVHSVYIPTVMLGPFHLCSNCDVGDILFMFQL